MIFKRLFGKKQPDPSDALYATIVAAARQPKFYSDWNVPDSIDGRFDMMILHVFLVMDRLRHFGGEADALRQALTDHFFAEMDKALREVGVGDLTVGKKVRKMAEAYFGRATAYSTAMAAGQNEMSLALARNVFAGSDASHAGRLAAWSFQAKQILAGFELDHFQQGQVRFEP